MVSVMQRRWSIGSNRTERAIGDVAVDKRWRENKYNNSSIISSSRYSQVSSTTITLFHTSKKSGSHVLMLMLMLMLMLKGVVEWRTGNMGTTTSTFSTFPHRRRRTTSTKSTCRHPTTLPTILLFPYRSHMH